jgi:hypothetical protein
MRQHIGKKLPLGESFFKYVIENSFYYIDKTLLVHHIIESSNKILLFPRPRRFGKTFNISMLHCFFEKSEPSSAHLFNGLAIQKQTSWQHQGKYPVIFISLKSCAGQNWQNCLTHFSHEISSEYIRHEYLLDSDHLNAQEKIDFQTIISRNADQDMYEYSLKKLSKYLKNYHNQNVVILCDEYDTPIHSGYLNNYYDDVINFMRGFLGNAYKDNSNLYKGVLTGILRIARESIFSDLNNLDVFTILEDKFSEFYGITQDEMQQLITNYHLSDHEAAIKKAYDGYQFGNHTIYNPWSVLHYCAHPDAGPKRYWINTSGNGLIKKLIFEERMITIDEVQSLINGQTVWKTIDENLVMNELITSSDAVWNLLLFSGYLTIIEKKADPDNEEHLCCCLTIPNTEIKRFFMSEIQKKLRSSKELEARKKAKIEIKQDKTIFISYNHKDAEFVKQLKKDLEHAKIQFIIDTEHMKFGDDIQEFIERSLQSANITLSIISENSLASPWVMLETLEAFQQENDIQSMRYIPVMIDTQFQSSNFASRLISHIEKSIDFIVDEITRLSKKYLSTQSLSIKKERLIMLRSNIDQILLNLDKRRIADFSTQMNYEINFPRLVEAIKS